MTFIQRRIKSMQSRDVASTLMQRCFYVACPAGHNAYYICIILPKYT